MGHAAAKPSGDRGAAIETDRSANADAFVQTLIACPGVTLDGAVAVIGARAPACQIALALHGFNRVAAVPPTGARLLRERYGCLGVIGAATAAALDDATLATWRRRLRASGTLLLDVSAMAARAELARRLRAAGFAMLQYRVVGMKRPDGSRARAVFLIARAPRAAVAPASRQAQPSTAARAA